MNFDKESKSEEKKIFCLFFFFCGGGGGARGEGGRGGFQPEKNTINNRYPLFFVLMLYIKFQIIGSSGSLVLSQTKEVTDR